MIKPEYYVGKNTAPASGLETRPPSYFSTELLAMMRTFVDALETSSDPTLPLELLRHTIEIAYGRLR